MINKIIIRTTIVDRNGDKQLYLDAIDTLNIVERILAEFDSDDSLTGLERLSRALAAMIDNESLGTRVDIYDGEGNEKNNN